jgi:hypothetical protein
MATSPVVTLGDLDLAFSDADADGSPDAVIARIQAAVDDPALRGEEFSVAYALVMVSDLQVRSGRPEEAEATLRAAVAANVRDDATYVDPHASLAALLVDRGRGADAAREFALLKESGCADGNAYLIYGEALEVRRDFAAAINVYAAGEVVADRTGDASLAAMLRQSADRARNDGVPSVPRVAVPALARRAPELDEDWPGEPAAEIGCLLFWPRAEHDRLVARWPALAEEVGRDWDEHRARLERLLAGEAAEGGAGVLAVADFASFTAVAGDAPEPGALDRYVRRHGDVLESRRWPPERNAPCWCGSGRKYKLCCRPRGFVS